MPATRLFRATVGALHSTIRPADFDHKGAPILEIGEVLDSFLEGCGRVHGDRSMF